MASGRKVKVAASQFECCLGDEGNLVTAERLVRQSAEQGAQIILLQELFCNLYFCQEQDPKWFATAIPAPSSSSPSSPLFEWACKLAKELSVVLPISFFEKAGTNFFNSLVVIDADGSILEGVYRKTHIPDGPGYQEKFYFSPGDSGFRVWQTKYAKIGVAICWDQWFPEVARSLALLGAEILFYPTAIGSEPPAPEVDTSEHWRRAMQGHSASNMVPVVASNRIGFEKLSDVPTVSSPSQGLRFYGKSFITDQFGKIIAELDREANGVIVETIDLDGAEQARVNWGVFRDRRPVHYRPLLTLDGKSNYSG